MSNDSNQESQNIISETINTPENRMLLMRYLVKYFGKDKAKELFLANKDKWWEYGNLAYSMGKRDMSFFALYYLQDIFVPKPNNQARELSDTHYEVIKLLESCLLKDEFDKLLLVLPRGFAKSTLVTYMSVIHQAVYETQTGFYQVVIGKTENDAQNFIFEVRKTLEDNEYIKTTFGKLIDSRRFVVNKNMMQLTNNCKIEAISSSSSCRGRKHLNKRPSAFYLDDIVGLDDVLTDQAKQKKMEVFQKDILYAGDEPVYRDGKKVKAGTKFLVCGTILDSDCFTSQLLIDKSFKSIKKQAVLVDDIDKLFNENEYWIQFKQIYYDSKNPYADVDAKDFYYANREHMDFPVLWTQKWECLDLGIKYYGDPLSFKQELQNLPSKQGEKCFFNIKTMTTDDIEAVEFDRTLITVDCAVEVGLKNDYTAVCVGSRGLTGHRYIRKGLIYKKHFDESVETVFELLHKYPDVSHVIIEKNTFQGRFEAELNKLVLLDEQLRKRNLTIEEKRQHSNKENRIRSISSRVNNGFIIFNKHDENFYNQILDYQGSKIGHDDAIDSVQMLDAEIDEINTMQRLSFLDRRCLGL